MLEDATPSGDQQAIPRDPLAALPEAELRTLVLMQLCGADKRAASLVCHSWRAAVAALPVSRLTLTTEQIAQPAFLHWLRQPRKAAQVRDFSVSAPEGCVGEICMAVAETRRLLSCILRYGDHVSQQVDRVVAELPTCVKHLDIGTPASVAAARLQLDRLASLESIVLEAGFYQEITGLPATLHSLRLHRNVVYVRLLGDLSGLETLEVPVYQQEQLAAVCALPRLRRVRLHLYAGVGLSLGTLPDLASTLEHLDLRAYGAALTEAGALASLSRLTALSLDVDLSFFGHGARAQEIELLDALQLPPSLRRLRIARSWQGFLPPSLVQRVDPLRPRLRQLYLSALPPGWKNFGDAEPWMLE